MVWTSFLVVGILQEALYLIKSNIPSQPYNWLVEMSFLRSNIQASIGSSMPPRKVDTTLSIAPIKK